MGVIVERWETGRDPQVSGVGAVRQSTLVVSHQVDVRKSMAARFLAAVAGEPARGEREKERERERDREGEGERE